jgi:hypothetical protein
MKKYRSERKGRRNFDTAPHYNTVDMIATENTRTARSAVRATNYVAPLAKLQGREAQIFAERDHKLEAARRQRQRRRQEAFVPLSDRVGDASTAALN